jgi:hypothetical protein
MKIKHSSGGDGLMRFDDVDNALGDVVVVESDTDNPCILC